MAEQKTTETAAVETAGYATPNVASKGAKWLTFEYTLAMLSVTLATVISVVLSLILTGLWRSEGVPFLTPISSLPTANLLSIGILSVIFAVLALVLFGRVTRAVTGRSGYTDRLSYKLVTYGSAFVLVLIALPLAANLTSVLISSLLLIGAGDAGTVYGSLYIGTFLPSLVGLGIVATILFFISKIVCGYNKSRILSVILLIFTAIIAIALAITLAVKAHDKPKIKLDPKLDYSSIFKEQIFNNNPSSSSNSSNSLKDYIKY